MSVGRVLWIDSNVLRRARSDLERLAELAAQKGVRLVVHPENHLEVCRHLLWSMRKRGMPFSRSYIDASLRQLGIEVVEVTLDQAKVEGWAELLDRRYPERDDFAAAKLEAVRSRLPDGYEVSSKGISKGVPMTTDWLIALEVEARGDTIAVEDKGPEWASLRREDPPRALSYEDVLRWLSAMEDKSPAKVPS